MRGWRVWRKGWCRSVASAPLGDGVVTDPAAVRLDEDVVDGRADNEHEKALEHQCAEFAARRGLGSLRAEGGHARDWHLLVLEPPLFDGCVAELRQDVHDLARAA